MNMDDEIVEFKFNRSKDSKLVTLIESNKKYDVLYDKLKQLASSIEGVYDFGRQINVDNGIYLCTISDSVYTIFISRAQQLLRSHGLRLHINRSSTSHCHFFRYEQN